MDHVGRPAQSFPQAIKMTLENVTSAVLAGKRAKLLRKIAEIENWLGGRDSNPNNAYF
jgi:hypothetical protein